MLERTFFSNKASRIVESKRLPMNKRLALPLILAVFIALPATRWITLSVLTDAFFQVAAFVFATLAIYYSLSSRISEHAISRFLSRHPAAEVGMAALLGALPGCGGAIVVVTQYTKGATSFGAVAAVLTSTMGDAAFLLLAQAPLDGLTVMGVSVVTGTLTGMLINTVHNYRDGALEQADGQSQPDDSEVTNVSQVAGHLSVWFWAVFAIPSVSIAGMLAFQIDVPGAFGLSESVWLTIGSALALCCITLWALSSKGQNYSSLMSEDKSEHPIIWQHKSAMDTQFVLSWVVVAFLLFELLVEIAGVDIAHWLSSMGSGVVGLAILIGFLPGCGPQILVTSLYLNGAIPFSAQLGNAISNDGDALFPAIALSPRAALLATVYSAVPAVLVAYSYWWWFE